MNRFVTQKVKQESQVRLISAVWQMNSVIHVHRLATGGYLWMLFYQSLLTKFLYQELVMWITLFGRLLTLRIIKEWLLSTLHIDTLLKRQLHTKARYIISLVITMQAHGSYHLWQVLPTMLQNHGPLMLHVGDYQTGHKLLYKSEIAQLNVSWNHSSQKGLYLTS